LQLSEAQYTKVLAGNQSFRRVETRLDQWEGAGEVSFLLIGLHLLLQKLKC